MIDKLIEELKILKQKDMLLTRITNILSSYFHWSDREVLRKQYEKNLEGLLEEYYELINKENSNG